MPIETRAPADSDLPSIIALTRRNRTLLAELELHFWGKSAHADELHAAFFASQIANKDLVKRVLERDGEVIGYAVSVAHPSGFYFIDDVCLAESADWQTDGAVLIDSIEERPAIMTVPHGHTARVQALLSFGLERFGTVRSLRFDQEPALELGTEPVAPMAPPARIAASPVHVWLPAMAPENVTCVGDGDGYAVISPQLFVPPIYDPGGSPCVVDRVIGEHRDALLGMALDFSHQRGDVGVILVVEEADTGLSELADRLGARHPVDLMRWPDQ